MHFHLWWLEQELLEQDWSVTLHNNIHHTKSKWPPQTGILHIWFYCWVNVFRLPASTAAYFWSAPLLPSPYNTVELLSAHDSLLSCRISIEAWTPFQKQPMSPILYWQMELFLLACWPNGTYQDMETRERPSGTISAASDTHMSAAESRGRHLHLNAATGVLNSISSLFIVSPTDIRPPCKSLPG